MSSTPPDDSQRKEKPRGPRLVGRIVDPAVDDGLGLSGPGAPGAPSLVTEEEHPVKARLLARARLARGEGTEEDRFLVAGSNELSAVPSATGPAHAAAGASAEEAAGSAAPVHGEEGDSRAASSATVPPSPFASPLASEPEGFPQLTRDATHARPALGSPRETSIEESSAPLAPPAGFTPPPGAVASELERIARGGAALPPTRASLSPNMVALLSALIGLSLVGSIGIFVHPFDFAATEGTPATEVPSPTTTPPEAPPAVATPERKKIAGPWRIEQDERKAGYRVLRGKMGKNAFLRAIQDAGLPKSEAYRAYGALKELLDLDHCSSSDTFLALVRGSNKELVAFEYEKSKEEVYQAKADDNGRFAGKRLDLQVARNQIRRGFVFDGTSFEDSARRAGFDPGLTKVAEEAFRGHLSLRELRRGDRLRIIAQEMTVLGEFSRYTGIEALELVREGKEPIRIYYYSHPAEGGYFDVNGKAPYEGGWRKPIPTAPITSKFNMKRMHPVLNKVMPHTGTDFGAPMGTPIGATAPGTVTFIGYAGPSGNLVKVGHDGGYESGYAHLSRFEQGLKVGDSVARLQTVGYCGSTGRSTGPHLHFTMKKDGAFIDPESLNLDGLRVLPPSHRATFAEVRSKYDPILDAIVLPPPLVAAPTPPEAAPAAEGSTSEEPASARSDDDEGEESGNPMMQDEAAAPAAPAPSAPTPPAPASSPRPAGPSAPSPAGAPATAVTPSAIFLSDEDLLRMQGQSDDGEVNP